MSEIKPVSTKNLKLKSARAAMDLSQQELAELAGLARQMEQEAKAGAKPLRRLWLH